MKELNQLLSKMLRTLSLKRFPNRNFLIVLSLVASNILRAQETVTLESCYDAVVKNYPLVAQKGLILSGNALSIKNLNANYLPQIEIGGQATWQSEVTQLELPANPFFKAPTPLSQDQYKLTLDIRENIYDGGFIRHSKAIQNAAAATEIQKLEVELYKLRERVNQLYFSVLQANENISLVKLLKADIEPRLKKVKAGIEHGVAIPMNQRALEAELIKADQKISELMYIKKAAILMLNELLKTSFNEQTKFEKPISYLSAIVQNSRPELKLFAAQKSLLAEQADLTRVRNMPRLSAFATGGYGKPGLNFLKNEFRPYAILGLSAKWNVSDKISGREHRDRELLGIQDKTIDLQKEIFELNSNLQVTQCQSEIERYRELMQSDKMIIELREKNKVTLAAQLDSGIISANDYLIEVNAENQARQNLILHELQMKMNEVNLKTILGN
ncbi:MAG: TolC family protein [Saprospiraceae bacterium]